MIDKNYDKLQVIKDHEERRNKKKQLELNNIKLFSQNRMDKIKQDEENMKKQKKDEEIQRKEKIKKDNDIQMNYIQENARFKKMLEERRKKDNEDFNKLIERKKKDEEKIQKVIESDKPNKTTIGKKIIGCIYSFVTNLIKPKIDDDNNYFYPEETSNK